MMMTRREAMGWLGLAGLSGVLPWTGGCLRGGWSPRRSRKAVVVGAHPWVYAATLPNHDITPKLDDIFSDMSYAGMEGIELMHEPLRNDGTVRHIRELSQKHQLPVIGTSYGADLWDRNEHSAIFEDAERIIGNLASLGGRTLGTSVGAAGERKTPEQLDAQAEALQRLMKLCKSKRVVLNLHNHTYEVENDLHDLRGTLERVPNVKLGPDLNWLVRGGVDPVWFIKTFGDRIVFLHLRDQHANGKWSEALGEGDMDYGAIAAALKDVSFKGHAIIELAHEGGFRPTRPLRESLRLSRGFVRETFGY